MASEQNELDKYFLENDHWEDYINAQIKEQNDDEESNSEDNSSDSDEQWLAANIMKNTTKESRSINCSYLRVKLNEKGNLKGYADSGATISLISNAVLSEKILKSLSVCKGNVKDANGNSVNILGEIAVLMKVN